MIHRNCVRVQAFVHACKCVRLFPLHSIYMYIGQTLPGTECALQATHAIWCVCVCVCVCVCESIGELLSMHTQQLCC